MNQNDGNVLLLYGGGLCDCANVFLRTVAKNLSERFMFPKVFIGFYSFRSLIEEQLIFEWNVELNRLAEKNLGGFFGTCRNVFMDEPENFKKSIKICKERNIKWIFVAGGDGSSRQVAEMSAAFNKEGIKTAFIMPMTIDGIEGGASLGMAQAVRVSVKCIENIVATCLRTCEKSEYCNVIVETQGRNRDDILAHVLQELSSKQCFEKINPKIDEKILASWNSIKIFAVPANYKSDINSLISAINSINKPCLILISEGALIKKSELKALLKRKTRTYNIGHLSQMNNMTNSEDIEQINQLVSKMCDVIEVAIMKDKPFTIVTSDIKNPEFTLESIDYFAKLNPKENQKPKLQSKCLESMITSFTK